MNEPDKMVPIDPMISYGGCLACGADEGLWQRRGGIMNAQWIAAWSMTRRSWDMTELEGMEVGEHRTKIATAILCGDASDEDVKELALDVLAHPWPKVERTMRVTGNPLFARLPERFQWFAHNVFGHPLSEILFQVGLEDWGNRFHDWTIPAHETGTGRG